MSERTVLFLAIPDDVSVRAGPVTVAWPDRAPVEADVLGCDFTGPDAFMAERDAALDMLPALRGLVEIIDAAGLANLSIGVQLGPTSWYVKANDRLERARAVIAQATRSEVPA